MPRGAAWPTKNGKGFTVIKDSGARYVLLPPKAEQSGDVRRDPGTGLQQVEWDGPLFRVPDPAA